MEAYTLVKPSSGEIQTFLYRGGLQFQNSEGTSELLPEALDDYDILIDENDVIHILCQDMAGCINHIFCEQGTWQKQVVLESKNQEVSPKKIRLIRVGKFNNAFYILRHEGKNMLVHHILDHPPEVVDYIYRDVEDIALYQKQKLFAFYREQKGGAVSFRRYDWSLKSWGSRQDLGIPEAVFLKALCDGEEFFLVFRVKNKLYFQKYETFDGSSLVPSGGKILLTEDSRIRDCILLSGARELYVLWEGENGPCTVVSSDRGKTFGSVRKLPYARYTALYRLRSCTDEPFCADTYGYTLSGKLNLLAHDRFMLPQISKREVTYVSQTKEAEDFAGIAAQTAESKDAREIELNKLKIRLANLERQVQQQMRQLSMLNSRFEMRTQPQEDSYKPEAASDAEEHPLPEGEPAEKTFEEIAREAEERTMAEILQDAAVIAETESVPEIEYDPGKSDEAVEAWKKNAVNPLEADCLSRKPPDEDRE